MKKWYADNTELSTTKTKNNVLIFGGIIIDEIEEQKLKLIIEEVKSKYALKTLPIKWNFKDLKPTYIELSRIKEYESLLSSSYKWRREIFEKSLSINYKIILACTERYSSEKPLSRVKEDLISVSFSQSLMRVALYAKNNNVNDMYQVVLDWPESSNPKPFNREYFKAFHKGTSTFDCTYFSGALKNINFCESIYYTKSTHCTMLQFADLIIGACKDYILKHLHETDNSLGFDLTELIKCKIQGYPNKIIEYGFNYAPKGRTYELVKSSFDKFPEQFSLAS